MSAVEERTNVQIPVVGRYHDEIRRGELRSDMTAWGARDFIVADAEVRECGWQCGRIDEARLGAFVDEVMKLS